MEGTGVVDRFLDLFARYIDSGFGLISGDVGFLASSLIVIDVTLALLFATWGAGEDVIARLVKKTIQVGFFAFLISNWNSLARIIFLSFSGIGLKAAGSSGAETLLHPGRIAQIGLDAGQPMIDKASYLVGPVGLFTNFVDIMALLFAWAVVLLAFFIIAIQMFVTLIEFKLVTLAGFVLVPFGLFGRTAFLAEKVLGNVFATGVKVLVLAVIIGIGSTIFNEFVSQMGSDPTLEQAGTLILASLTMLGLAIFGPGIATGLVSGGPQLGAGAAVGTGLTIAGIGAAGGAAVAGAASLAGRAGSAAAATYSRSAGMPPAGGPPPVRPSANAAAAGGAPGSPPGSGASGGGTPSGGGSGGGGAGSGSGGGGKGAGPKGGGGATAAPPAEGAAASSGASNPALGDGDAPAATGAAPEATATAAPAPSPAPAAASEAPTWAKRLRRRQQVMQGATLAANTLRGADSGGAAHISLEDKE